MPFQAAHSSDHRHRPLLAAALLLLLSAPRAGGASEPIAWKLDPVHTRVMFAVSHAGFSKAIGTVSGADGGLLFNPGDWAGSQLVVDVPMTRLDLGDPDWNRAALAGNLLDGAAFPTARFVSTTVTARDAQHAEVCGDLTLHGVTRPLCMDVTVNAAERHPMPPFRLTAGFSATATLSRSDHGIDAWPSMIGDEVELRIEAEATRASAAFAENLQAAITAAATAPRAPDTAIQPRPGPTP